MKLTSPAHMLLAVVLHLEHRATVRQVRVCESVNRRPAVWHTVCR